MRQVLAALHDAHDSRLHDDLALIIESHFRFFHLCVLFCFVGHGHRRNLDAVARIFESDIELEDIGWLDTFRRWRLFQYNIAAVGQRHQRASQVFRRNADGIRNLLHNESMSIVQK